MFKHNIVTLNKSNWNLNALKSHFVLLHKLKTDARKFKPWDRFVWLLDTCKHEGTITLNGTLQNNEVDRS